MPTYEGLRLKVLECRRKLFAKYRNKQLKVKDFTIISNNCWGGMTYEAYDLPKESPTVGLFFMASDYIHFLEHLKEYLTRGRLSFIDPQQSKWRQQVCSDKRFGHYPMGVLTLPGEVNGVEVFFLHYHSEDEARTKWSRRCQRVNWNRLIVKFNDQNECKEEDIDKYIVLPYDNKLFFTVKHWDKEKLWIKQLGSGYKNIHQPGQNEFVMASREPFGKAITNYKNYACR